MNRYARSSLVAAGLLFAFAAGAADVKSGPAPWLVAQAEKGCYMDGQQMAPGTIVCHEKKTWTCTASGTWSITSQKCSSSLPKRK